MDTMLMQRIVRRAQRQLNSRVLLHNAAASHSTFTHTLASARRHRRDVWGAQQEKMPIFQTVMLFR